MPRPPLKAVVGLVPYAGNPSKQVGELLECGHFLMPSSSAKGAGKNGAAAVARRLCVRCNKKEPVSKEDKAAAKWLEANPGAKGWTL